MRERGAFGFLIVLLVAAIWLLDPGTDEIPDTAFEARTVESAPSIVVNGRSYTPVYRGGADAGLMTDRMVIVVDRDALAAGENTIEIHWGEAPLPTLTAKLPGDTSAR